VSDKAHFVLVVEDDRDIQLAVRDVLELEGYLVETADNGRQALEILERDPRPCLILLDLMMPVMNGHELSARLKGDPRLATNPVVLMSADQHLEEKAKLLDAQGILPKPVDIYALLELVESYCLPSEANDA
jgi:two-component system, chemotaxis family, chemotaxis protein CheY